MDRFSWTYCVEGSKVGWRGRKGRDMVGGGDQEWRRDGGSTGRSGGAGWHGVVGDEVKRVARCRGGKGSGGVVRSGT